MKKDKDIYLLEYAYFLINFHITGLLCPPFSNPILLYKTTLHPHSPIPPLPPPRPIIIEMISNAIPHAILYKATHPVPQPPSRAVVSSPYKLLFDFPFDNLISPWSSIMAPPPTFTAASSDLATHCSFLHSPLLLLLPPHHLLLLPPLPLPPSLLLRSHAPPIQQDALWPKASPAAAFFW